MSAPLLSIITIHLQDFQGLQRTCESIKPILSEHKVEWVVVDGQSTFHNNEEEKFLARISSLANIFISESDRGIYDAMNKGVSLASGEYVLFLNAGDELDSNLSFDVLRKIFKDQPEMVWGQCQQEYRNRKRVKVRTRHPRWAWYAMPVCHQAVFFLKSALGEKPYDLSYKIASDYDLLMRLIQQGGRTVITGYPVSVFVRGGVTQQHLNLGFSEDLLIRKKYYPEWPSVIHHLVTAFKTFNERISRIVWLRKLWRRWI